MDFEKYMKQVDYHLGNLTDGAIVSHLELEDFLYRDAFDDGVDPRMTAEDALSGDSLFGAYREWWILSL